TLPESVVGRMFLYFAPERQLLEPGIAGKIADRSLPQKIRIIVVSFAGNGGAFPARGRLLGEVVNIGLAKRAVMKPIVAHPTVHHRAFGSRYLQRRMRMNERHH